MAGAFRLLARALLPLALATAPAAVAGSYAVSPVTVVLTPGRLVGEVTVENRGAEPISIEARVFAWSQRGGEDVLEATREAIAFPPAFTLPAGQSQTVRVGLRAAPEGDVERAWRLRLDELPPGTAPGQVAVTVRQVLPVFFRPAAAGEPEVAAARTAAGVVLENRGRRHVRALSVAWSDAQGRRLAENHEPFYLLPGAARTLPVPEAARDGARLTLQTPQGALAVAPR